MRGRAIGTLLILTAAALLASVGCGGGGGDGAAGTPGTAGGVLNVVATTSQIAALAREVAGERAEVRAIIRPGVEPHDFEPTPGDLATLNTADLVLRHGVGLDSFLDRAALRVSGAPVVTATRGIGDHYGALGGRDFDPHVWLDPMLAKVMVENIRDALVTVNPAGRATYEANAAAYNSRLDEVNRQISEMLAGIPSENRKIVTNHDAFGYFARRYRLEVVGAVIPTVSSEGEPSAQETAALLDTIREEGVKAIFVESTANPDLARQLARDAGVKVAEGLYVDSLGGPGSGAETVDGMLLADARLIAEALK